MLSLWDALGVSSTKIPVNVTTTISYVLPPIICYIAAAVLAVTPRTRVARLALWPIVASLALRAAFSVDMSLGRPEQKYLHAYFVSLMFNIAARTLDWTLTTEPLVRHVRPENSTPSMIMDALDLATNLRGLGWNWSHGLYIPHDTRPKSPIAFVFHAFLSAITHAFVCVILHRAILSFAGVESVTQGSTIFDTSLPLVARYIRATIITALGGLLVYASMQMGYDLCSIPAVLVLGQDSTQWPAPFDSPWRSTSLHDFWGRRWHQWCRRMFLFLAGYPLSVFLGPAGIIVGAFLASTMLHDIMLVYLDDRAEVWRMLVAFGIMGPLLLVERGFCRLTGKRVGGVAGWVWTMAWLSLSGSVMFQSFARATGLGDPSLTDGILPTWMQAWVEHLVIDFDAWLHAI